MIHNSVLWQVAQPSPDDFVQKFPEYSRLISQLLFNRGLDTQEKIDEFFDADYSAHMHDPYLFRDMEKAVERILRAIEKKEKIVIYGDYDADGISGSVILYSALSLLGANSDVYIPDRFSEGYGLNKKALDEILKNKKTGLIITVDCGVTNAKEVDFINEQGRDVIIVDHHIVPSEPPRAFAIINPKSAGEEYPFQFFCAAGVAFKLAGALLKSEYAVKKGVKEGAEKWLLDVAAIGSVADMVPLLGENRTLVKYGLIVMKKTKRAGLRALLNLRPARSFNGVPANGEITSETIAFSIAPRINATSRLAHATVSFELLIAEDEDRAERFAREVEGLNNDRRKVVDQILKEATAMIDESAPIIFIGKDEWPVGVVGLVAGRLSERYGRPAFVYGRANSHAKGSCRGIGGFNVVEVMRFCQNKESDLLMEFGGHSMAGGFAIALDKLDRFKKYLLSYGEEALKREALRPILPVEAEAAPDDIGWELFDWLKKFEPYGEGNKKPAFLLRGAEAQSLRKVGGSQDHLKIKLKTTLENGSLKFFDCIGFGLSSLADNLKEGDKLDAVFELEANEWNGTRELQLKLKDIRKPNI